MYAYPTVSVPKLHFEYRIWITELDFFNEEIELFEHHLQHMVLKSKGQCNKVKVDYYQNCFNHLKEVIQLIKSDLQQAEKKLSLYVKEVSGMGLLSIKMDNHTALREEMNTFKKWHKMLKNEFRRTEMEWLKSFT